MHFLEVEETDTQTAQLGPISAERASYKVQSARMWGADTSFNDSSRHSRRCDQHLQMPQFDM